MAANFRNVLPHQDTPFLRVLHIIVAVLVLAQIINSNLTECEALGQFTLAGVVTWLHIISGFGLLFCSILNADLDAKQARLSILLFVGAYGFSRRCGRFQDTAATELARNSFWWNGCDSAGAWCGVAAGCGSMRRTLVRPEYDVWR